MLPATGYVSPDQSVSGWLWSLTLPVTALLIGAIANAAAQFRSAVLDAAVKDYVRTLRSRGIPESKPCSSSRAAQRGRPRLVVLSLTTLGLFGGALFIEAIFALPGVGQLSVSAALAGDVPMVMGTVIVVTILVLVVNLLADSGSSCSTRRRGSDDRSTSTRSIPRSTATAAPTNKRVKRSTFRAAAEEPVRRVRPRRPLRSSSPPASSRPGSPRTHPTATDLAATNAPPFSDGSPARRRLRPGATSFRG